MHAPLWLLSKHNESSAGSEEAAISPEKEAGPWNSAEAVHTQEAADPPSGSVLGARTQVVCCRSSLRACVLLWLGSPDHCGLLWVLGQSPSPAKDRIPKQAPSALCPSPLSGYSLHQPSPPPRTISPPRVSQHIPAPRLPPPAQTWDFTTVSSRTAPQGGTQ